MDESRDAAMPFPVDWEQSSVAGGHWVNLGLRLVQILTNLRIRRLDYLDVRQYLAIPNFFQLIIGKYHTIASFNH